MKNITKGSVYLEEEQDSVEKLSKSTLDSIARMIPGLIYVNDFNEMKNIYCCKNTVNFIGIDEKKISKMGKDFFTQILHPDDHYLILNASQYFKNFKHKTEFGFICRLKHKDGGWRWIYNSGKIIEYNNDGTARHVLGIAHDTSALIDRKNFEKILSDLEYRKKNLEKFRSLTIREIEILCLITDGLKNHEIADKLFISPQTVETHRKNLIKKLNGGSLPELIRFANMFCGK